MQYSFKDFKVIHNHINQVPVEFNLYKLNTKVYLNFDVFKTDTKTVYGVSITWTARSSIHGTEISSFVYRADGFIQYENKDDEVKKLKSILEQVYENFEVEYYEYISDKQIAGNNLPPNQHLNDDELEKYLAPMRQEFGN